MWLWFHVNWNVSPHPVALWLNIEAMGCRSCLYLCVWSSRFPPHPSLWQRRTNQSPPCLFSFHHTRPTSSFISRPAFMKTHGGRIISRWDGLTEVYTVPMWPEAISSVCVCLEYFPNVFTRCEQTLVKVMMLGGQIIFGYCRLFYI